MPASPRARRAAALVSVQRALCDSRCLLRYKRRYSDEITKVEERYDERLVWCSLLSGLLMQSFMLTAKLDGIRESGPTLLCGQ